MSTRAISVPDAKAVVLAKQLLGVAQAHFERRTALGRGLAVSLAQDAAEAVLRSLARFWSLQLKKPDHIQFHELLSECDTAFEARGLGRLPRRQHLAHLNNARVAFKHFGHCPDENVARSGLADAEDFHADVCRLAFGLDADHLSLADLIEHEPARAAIKGAEAHIAADKRSSALQACALANHHLESIARRHHPGRQGRGPTYRADDFTRAVAEVLTEIDDVRLQQTFALLGVDPWQRARFKALVPHCSVSYSGVPQYVTQLSRPVTREGVELCIKYVIDLALELQERIPKWWHEPLPFEPLPAAPLTAEPTAPPEK